MAQIHEAIANIMGDVGAIKKDRKNASQGYNFRGIDDVYLAIHDLFVKHGVFSVPTVEEDRTEERTTKGGSALIYRVLRVRYDFFARDGSSISAVVMGEGMDSGDKASNKAMSVAHKYAILQLLAIPTDDTIDAEVDSHEVAPKKASVNVHETPTAAPEPNPVHDSIKLEMANFVAVMQNPIYTDADRAKAKAKVLIGKGDTEAYLAYVRSIVDEYRAKIAPAPKTPKAAAERVSEMFAGLPVPKAKTEATEQEIF